MELTIGEVAEQAEIRASAIRYYESVGILPVPARVSGQRRYEPEVLHMLRAIGFAKDAGFTVDEMRQLFQFRERQEPPSAAWERLARRKLEEVDAMIARAESMKRLLETGLQCGCLGIDECVLFAGSAAAAARVPVDAKARSR